MLTVRVPERDRNKCERVTGPQPERVRSIFAGVNATRTSGTEPERDRNANRIRCEHGLTSRPIRHPHSTLHNVISLYKRRVFPPFFNQSLRTNRRCKSAEWFPVSFRLLINSEEFDLIGKIKTSSISSANT